MKLAKSTFQHGRVTFRSKRYSDNYQNPLRKGSHLVQKYTKMEAGNSHSYSSAFRGDVMTITCVLQTHIHIVTHGVK